MSYRPRPDFDRPTAESVQRSRRATIWIIPAVILQQSTLIFGRHGDEFSQLVGAICWTALTIAELWWLLGLPFRWLSERDQAILNDEWSRSVSGDAARWGIATAALVGCAMMISRIWVPLDAGIAIYALVNSALIIAVVRYWWLDRDEPGEDE
jgi:hypothetical protein